MIEYVCPVEESLYEEVLNHLRHTFFHEEPLNASVGLCSRPGEGHERLEAVCLDTLRDGLSVAALENGCRVVGAALNGSQTRQQLLQAVHELETEPDEKFRHIFTLLYGANHRLDLFTKYGVERLFECRILSVAPECRGRGVARALLERSEQEARARGFTLFKEDATGLVSQRLARRQGMHLEAEVVYSEHLGDDGEPIFNPPDPHTSLQVMAKLL
ncbi:hypothetical protein B566_EDAN014103 [Ephemera danica]|nr:hypothetical protein B566_EDAN014103 [Ephemera danica]